MNVSKITVSRLYNLGNYEHVRYELTAEVPQGESPATAIIGLEKILAGLSPKTSTHSRAELARVRKSLEAKRAELREIGEERFRREYGGFEGTAEEYLARCEASLKENEASRDAWEARSAKARKLLDDLGGAANWRDAKSEWDDDGDY